MGEPLNIVSGREVTENWAAWVTWPEIIHIKKILKFSFNSKRYINGLSYRHKLDITLFLFKDKRYKLDSTLGAKTHSDYVQTYSGLCWLLV